jgi:sialate O-acetylesterase
MKKIFLGLFFLAITLVVSAQVRLPQLISDGMILQRDVPVKIWGWASPGEKVTITVIASNNDKNQKNQNNERRNLSGFQNLTGFSSQADAAGNWEIMFPAQKAGGPYSMTISGTNSITVQNILFGDVWLCSGQSNMETPVSRVMTLFGDEINGYSNAKIRYVKIPLTYNFQAPQTDVAPCSWTDLTPETAQNFSAVAYFFAKEMFDKTGVPVGLINSSVGGSPAEAWISEASLQKFPAMLNDMRICQSDEFVADMQRFGSLPARRWNAVLNEQDKGVTEAIQWSSADYDDSSWAVINFGDNSWGVKNFRPVNGVFWFRKEIIVPEELAGQEAMLYVGRLIDAVFTYVNGQLVGNTGYQYPPRNYAVPQGLLKAGKNTITVRLISQSGFPGFVSEKPYRLVFKNKESISLERGKWRFRVGAVMPPASGGGMTFQYKPTGLYNAMIAPLKNHAFKGVLWYQGESNTDRYGEYYDLMTLLMNDWRKLWGKDLPFLSVQLANYMEPALFQQNSNWAELRNVQRKLSQTVPNTGMAVAIDIGEWNDIHPLNKKDVGKRLALQARRLVYGEKITSDGPVYQSHIVEGNKIIISFKEGTNNLQPADELKGFAISGADGFYRPARAVIDGKRVVAWNDDIAQPANLRYAWANNPEGANLYNREGLPASPFQTEMAYPCVFTAPLNRTASGVQTFTNNSNGNVPLPGSPYGYEMWTNGGNDNILAWFGVHQGGGAAFRTEWNNPNNYLGRVGLFMDEGKPYTEYKHLYADYNYTRSANGTAGDWSYIGIYGWTKNPQIEWYIVEDWYDEGILNSMKILGTYKGDFTTCDGVEYKIYRNVRPAGAGNILGDGKPFPQYFSVRQRANPSPEKPMCGSIAITEHFEKWDTFDDMKMGSDLYEAKFLIETGGSTGWFEALYLKFSQEDYP